MMLFVYFWNAKHKICTRVESFKMNIILLPNLKILLEETFLEFTEKTLNKKQLPRTKIDDTKDTFKRSFFFHHEASLQLECSSSLSEQDVCAYNKVVQQLFYKIKRCKLRYMFNLPSITDWITAKAEVKRAMRKGSLWVSYYSLRCPSQKGIHILVCSYIAHFITAVHLFNVV